MAKKAVATGRELMKRAVEELQEATEKVAVQRLKEMAAEVRAAEIVVERLRGNLEKELEKPVEEIAGGVRGLVKVIGAYELHRLPRRLE